MELFILILVFLHLVMLNKMQNMDDLTKMTKDVTVKFKLLWKIITYVFSPIDIMLFCIFVSTILWINGNSKLACWFLLSLILTDVVGIALKITIKQKRPIDSICHRKGYSFPSGHVLSAMTLIYLLIFTFNLEKNIILVCIFITILLGIISSRIFLRQHHLLDVIASLVLSRICFLIAIFIWRIL